jgi:large subunit ribosomal protein L21
MYAIVKTGGKQYRVEQGQTLLVERLPQAEGETVSLEPLLLRSDETIFDAAGLAKVEVQATIVNHLRGKKLRVFKFKPKRGYRRRTGHRQELTRIEVTRIGSRTAARATAKPVAAPEPAAAASQPLAAARAVATPKPAAAPKGATTAKPAATAKSAATAQPAATAKPVAAPKSVASRKPAATPKPPAARKPTTRPKQAAPAEPDAAPSKEDTDGS